MMTAKRLTLLAALLMFLPSVQAASQDQMARSCEAEIESAERSIADARKKREYRSEQGRQVGRGRCGKLWNQPPECGHQLLRSLSRRPDLDRLCHTTVTSSPRDIVPGCSTSA